MIKCWNSFSYQNSVIRSAVCAGALSFLELFGYLASAGCRNMFMSPKFPINSVIKYTESHIFTNLSFFLKLCIYNVKNYSFWFNKSLIRSQKSAYGLVRRLVEGWIRFSIMYCLFFQTFSQFFQNPFIVVYTDSCAFLLEPNPLGQHSPRQLSALHWFLTCFVFFFIRGEFAVHGLPLCLRSCSKIHPYHTQAITLSKKFGFSSICFKMTKQIAVVVVHIFPPVTRQRQTLTIGRSAHFS